MNWRNFLLAFLVVGIVLNLYDYIIYWTFLEKAYAELTGLFNENPPRYWLGIGYFIYAFFFVLFYTFSYQCYPGVGRAILFGLLAGLLYHAPQAIFNTTRLASLTPRVVWYELVFGILGFAIAGLLTGAVYRE